MHEFGSDGVASTEGGLPAIVQEDVVTITPIMLRPIQRSGVPVRRPVTCFFARTRPADALLVHQLRRIVLVSADWLALMLVSSC